MYETRPPAVGSVEMATRIDLKRSLHLAGQNMLGILCPDRGYLPHWSCSMAHPPHVPETKSTFRWPGHNLGRWWDAMLRLSAATAFRIPAHIEAAMLGNLQRFFDNPDHLCLAPRDMAGVEPEFDLHSLREGLLALNALVRYRDSGWARTKGHAMIESLLRRVNEDGTWNAEEFDYPRRLKRKNDVFFTRRESTNTHGRLIEALLRFHQTTGDPSALKLAARLARYHLENTTRPDGAFNGASEAWHSHSYFGTLRGLLLFGERTGRRAYVDAVAATYRNTMAGKFVKRSGFSPHDIGGQTGETASTGDAAQIALWLGTRHGHTELLDDAARLLRCRIIPSQITEAPELVSITRDGPAEREDRRRDARIIGAYGGCHRSAHAGKSCVTDVTAAVLHTVVDFYNNVAARTESGIRVNFHLDYEDEFIRIASTRTRSAQVTITAKANERLWVRIPRWTPRESVRIRVDGEPLVLSMVGDFARVPSDLLPGEIVLEYGLPVSTHREVTADVEYELLWRGDEIIGIHPNTDDLPFYPTYVSPETDARLTLKSRDNLASPSRNVKVTASSYLDEPNDVGHPSHAIDGDENTLWISKQKVMANEPQWLQLDLGGVCAVRTVVVDHRFDLIGPSRYHIEMSADGERFETVKPATRREHNRRIAFEFRQGTQARYVRYVAEDTREREATVGHLEVYEKTLPD